MAENNMEKMLKRLRSLLSDLTGIEGTAVIRNDGTSVVSVLPPTLNEAEVAAISAAFIELCKKGSNELQLGEVREALIKDGNGYLVGIPCNNDLALVARVKDNRKLGLALRQMQVASKDLISIMS